MFSCRYGLKDDVRLSLYECVDEWLDAIGPHRKYMGGEVPNLADLVSRILHNLMFVSK